MGCTVEAITEKSGVAKTTIYRHWPSRTELLLDVLKNERDELPMPSTGALRTDLIEYLTVRAHHLQAYRFDISLRALPGLIEAAKNDPSVMDLPAKRTADIVVGIRAILEDGSRRGEVDGRWDLDVLANMIVGPIILQATFLGRRLSDEYIVELVSAFLDGAGRADRAHKESGARVPGRSSRARSAPRRS